MKTLLVTGSSGLLGSEVVDYFCREGWNVHGIDNNMRAQFFGPRGDTRWNLRRLQASHPDFKHHELDIRDRIDIAALIATLRPSLIVHTAGQPSHDLAASRPFDDFEVNAVGTLNLLEATRLYASACTFVYMSTNKVYGDRPNTIALKESSSRWDYADLKHSEGIREDLPIDRCTHSLFGVSKTAGDLMAQEYGKYFGMNTCCLRGGCLTGPNHSGVELHGFLNYLIRCNVERKLYKIYGYKGKQVRDNIHSYDVARFIHLFSERPRSGEVYNIGGGRANSVSILEAFDLITNFSGRSMEFEYIEENRVGDHICYISDLAKIRAHYPNWDITKSLEDIFREIYDAVLEAGYSKGSIPDEHDMTVRESIFVDA